MVMTVGVRKLDSSRRGRVRTGTISVAIVENASHRLTYSIAHGVEQGADRVSGVSSPIGVRVRAASLCTQFVFHSYIFLLD